MKLRRTHPPVEDRLTDEQRADLAALVPVSQGSAERATKFAVMRCQWCGGVHSMSCPRVKSLTFDGGNKVTGVTFWAWHEWPTHLVLWASDIWLADEK